MKQVGNHLQQTKQNINLQVVFAAEKLHPRITTEPGPDGEDSWGAWTADGQPPPQPLKLEKVEEPDLKTEPGEQDLVKAEEELQNDLEASTREQQEEDLEPAAKRQRLESSSCPAMQVMEFMQEWVANMAHAGVHFDTHMLEAFSQLCFAKLDAARSMMCRIESAFMSTEKVRNPTHYFKTAVTLERGKHNLWR